MEGNLRSSGLRFGALAVCKVCQVLTCLFCLTTVVSLVLLFLFWFFFFFLMLLDLLVIIGTGLVVKKIGFMPVSNIHHPRPDSFTFGFPSALSQEIQSLESKCA